MRHEQKPPPAQGPGDGGQQDGSGAAVNPIVALLHSLVNEGLAVFPCAPGGKQPLARLVPRGMDDASTDWATIEGWLRHEPPANWAVRTGPVASGPWAGRHLAVLDVDDTAIALAVLGRARVASLTTTTRTPRGGLHIWAISQRPCPSRPVVTAHGRHIGDLKADARDAGPGGYVLFWGHVTDTQKGIEGDYRLEWGPGPLLVEDAAAWFHALLEAAGVVGVRIAARPLGSDGAAAVAAPAAIFEGSRNDTLTSIAGSLRARGLDAAAIYAAIAAINQERCMPPLPDDEVRRIASGMERYPPGPNVPGAAAGGGNQLAEALERELAEAFTDVNLARLFAELAQGQALFVPAWGWIVWDGRRWARDEGGHRVMALAMEVLPRHFAERAVAAQGEARGQLLEMARKAMSRQRIANALELAKGLMLASPGDFDRDPFVLNALNGTVDLRTGELRPHNPADRLTKLCPVAYDPEAKATTWERFLGDIFLADRDLISFVQRALGYSATGDVREDALFLCHGPGANGKTTFLATVRAVLGDYAQAVAPDLLVSRRERGDSHPAVLADLCGARFCMAVETEEDRRLDEARAKMLTGRDPIKARYLHRGYFEFQPSHKLWLATNHLPVVQDTTEGMWRRLRVIPFNAFFPPERQDKELPQKLLTEAPGILAWLVEGARRWLAEGLGMAQAVQEATGRYRSEMDVLADWLQERCVPDPRAVTPTGELYADYAAWCERAGEPPLKPRVFGRRLGEKGFEAVKGTGGVRGRRGLRLRGDDYGGDWALGPSGVSGVSGVSFAKSPLNSVVTEEFPESDATDATDATGHATPRRSLTGEGGPLSRPCQGNYGPKWAAEVLQEELTCVCCGQMAEAFTPDGEAVCLAHRRETLNKADKNPNRAENPNKTRTPPQAENPNTLTCWGCGAPVKRGRGPSRRWCSDACRMRAIREASHRRQDGGPPPPLAPDQATPRGGHLARAALEMLGGGNLPDWARSSDVPLERAPPGTPCTVCYAPAAVVTPARTGFCEDCWLRFERRLMR